MHDDRSEELHISKLEIALVVGVIGCMLFATWEVSRLLADGWLRGWMQGDPWLRWRVVLYIAAGFAGAGMFIAAIYVLQRRFFTGEFDTYKSGGMMAGIGGNIAAMPLSEGGGGLRLELRPFCVRVHIEARDEACFAAEALVGATHLVCQICGTDVRFLALGAERRVALELSRGSGRLTIVPPATLVLMSAGEVVGFRGIDWFELYDEGLPAVEGYLEPEGVRA